MAKTLTVSIVGNADGLKRAFDESEGASRNWGKTIAAAAAALGAAIVGAGALAFRVGGEFHEAFSTIRVGTGQTGKALEGLKDDFRAVVRSVPADFASASTAVADLNTRLGLTGQPLQDLSKTFLDLSRITGTDLSNNIANVTRVFGDWDVATADQAETMDQLFRASQSTGAGIDQLASQVVQFGAPMRQLGFSFEETIALLGQFEKEGVNTELVMGSMRIALGRMAREGEEPIDTFRRITDAIKDAGDAGEANALALELFGARAGPDMAAAIREGRFEIDGLYDAIVNGSDTIDDAARDTEGWSEAWQRFTNILKAEVEPIATRVFQAITSLAETKLIPAVDKIRAWWDKNGPAITAAVDGVGQKFDEVVAAIRGFIDNTLIPAFRRFRQAWDDEADEVARTMLELREAFGEVADAIGGLMSELGAVWSSVSNIWRDDNRSTEASVMGLALGVVRYLTDSMNMFASFANAVTGAITHIREVVLDPFIAFVRNMGETIEQTIEEVIGWWRKLREDVPAALRDLPGLLFQLGKDMVQGLINGIVGMAGQVARALGNVVKGAVDSAKRALGISSPSKVFMSMGEDMMRGLQIGVDRHKVDALASLTANVPRLSLPGSVRGGDGGTIAEPMTLQFVVDGRVIGELATEYQEGKEVQLYLQGGRSG